MNHLASILMFGPPLLVAIILHEVAHGWMAEKLGDPTARQLGRITLNPIKHIDPMMTILVPAILILSGSPIIFGGAKPVPIDARNFKNPRQGMMLVALAGPMMNIFLACAAYLLLVIAAKPLETLPLLQNWLVIGILTNVVLATFNMIPIPPLDGGRIAVGLLPLPAARAYARIERYGLVIIVLILMSGKLNLIMSPVIEFTYRQLLKL